MTPPRAVLDTNIVVSALLWQGLAGGNDDLLVLEHQGYCRILKPKDALRALSLRDASRG